MAKLVSNLASGGDSAAPTASTGSGSNVSNGTGSEQGDGIGISARGSNATKIDALSDPTANPATAGGGTYTTKTITLYPNGQPSPTDVVQTRLSDCYVDSTLASMAETNPSSITNAISPDPSAAGVYDVKMYDPSGNPITVKVDSSILTNANGSTLSVRGGDGNADWSSIMEKAYAKYSEAYPIQNRGTAFNALSDGGHPADVMSAFMGKGASFTLTSSVNQLGPTIEQNSQAGTPMVAGTTTGGTTSDGQLISPTHAYTVVDSYQAADGSWRVQVRNPWGTNTQSIDSGSSGANDGIVDMSEADFRRLFPQFHEGNRSSSASGTNLNTRMDAFSAAAIAQNRDPEKAASFDDGNYSVVAGQDQYGHAQVQVFQGSGFDSNEENFLGGTALSPSTSYLVGTQWVNVDAKGTPTIGSSATQATTKQWDNTSRTFDAAQ